MTWRTIILSSDAKLSLRMNHLVVASEEVVRVPLDEIGTVIIENPNIVLTGHLINALSEHRITTILCDTYHNPKSHVNLIYGHHRQSKIIKEQFEWADDVKAHLWKKIVKQKIYNQQQVLRGYYKEREFIQFDDYISGVQLGDATNREGHAAKVYFNQLFGRGFSRSFEEPINWALNYGYSLILSLFNRTIVSKGLLTEVGVHHTNQFNQFNLASDFMEVYRPLVDYIVRKHVDDYFGPKEKRVLIEMFNEKVLIRKSNQYLPNSVSLYVDGLTKYLKTGDENNIQFPTFLYE